MNKKNRLVPLDLLRGALIILMALDHANFHIAHQHSSGEYWGGSLPIFSSPTLFWIRFVTHFCAPGFFFLMGAGMVLFDASRQRAGWKGFRIRIHFLVRGLVLIACQAGLDLIGVWSYPGSTGPRLYVGVLAALGAGMILAIPLLGLKMPSLLGLTALFSLALEYLTPAASAWGASFDKLAGVLLVYGGGTGDYWVNYPLLAWMEVILLGLVFGKLFSRDQNRAYQLGLRAGSWFLAGFALIRVVNGLGTIRPLEYSSLQGFLSVVKYPPSIAFVLLTMGVNLVALYVLWRLPEGIVGDANPLLVFGRAPLFSYVGHLLIYWGMGRLLAPTGASLGVMVGLWLAGLGVLYCPARWYGRFKSEQPPGSWVRFL